MRVLLCLAVLCGCGDDTPEPDVDAGPALDSIPSGELGAYPTEPRPGTCDFRGGSGSTGPDACASEPADTTEYFFVSRVAFPELVPREGERAGASGFDLDGLDSDGSAAGGGCRRRDFVSLDGRFVGVDNQGAALVPSIDSILESDLQTTAETAIAEGRFGVLIEIRHWNGTADDDCVDVHVHQASPVTTLELDADGTPRAGQTFLMEGASRTYVSERFEAGTLRADSGGFPVPQPFMMDLQSAHLRLQWDGTMLSGTVAGDMPSEVVVESLFCREPRFPRDVLQDILGSVSDLRPDSSDECQGVSWAIEVRAVAAFVADA